MYNPRFVSCNKDIKLSGKIYYINLLIRQLRASQGGWLWPRKVRTIILIYYINYIIIDEYCHCRQPHKHRKLTNQLSVHWKNIIIDAGGSARQSENACGVRLRPTRSCRLRSRRPGNDDEVGRVGGQRA